MPKKTKKPPPLPSLPPLTPAELVLLRNADYESPIRARGREKAVAVGLVARKLLEKNPHAFGLVVRCTEEGLLAREPLSSARARRVVDEIERLAEDDWEAAAGLEYSLWRRVLCESACGFVNGAVVRAALRSSTLPFRRG